MAKAPHKSITGWKHEVIEHKRDDYYPYFSIEGPGITGFISCEDKGDAETIAEALNMATAAKTIKRKARDLANQLTKICTIFEE